MRGFLAVLAIVMGLVALTLSPLAIWRRNVILNTDRYVATVAPLASNAGVRDAIVAQVDAHIEAGLPVTTYVKRVLPPRAAKVLASPIRSAVYGLINTTTTRFVDSKLFPTLWVTINRVAHAQLVAILMGKKIAYGALYIKSGSIVLDLGAVVEQVKDLLVKSGLTLAAHLPTVGATLEIAKAKRIERAQRLVRALNPMADWLPVLGLALVTGGIVLAGKRRRALIVAALGLCLGMTILGVGLIIARNAFASGVPRHILPQPTAFYIFDTVVRYLRVGVRLVFVMGLLVAAGAWVSGPSLGAVAVRRSISNTTRHRAQSGSERRVSDVVARYTNPLRVGVVGAAAFVLFFISGPTAIMATILAMVVAVLLMAIEVLRAGASHGPVKRN